ncbi:DUF960 domain-containing protein [Xylocopilactobacillus apicola]|uniref:GTP cyclohydrolase n=1 Tax=Xylocopilactobacillus apicola TaxID=2932184 RepID=A0AAU9DST0_9LACO|nr:DUF960 domain-containing protein [Xylocopilactobacillus apicola]BDR58358.1 GTP cyclohydrolase [Xylocopilactobacillus apicola]
MFDSRRGRFATYGVISHLPGEIIDTFWIIIDQNLQGVFNLAKVLNFNLIDNQGLLSIVYSQEESIYSVTFDLNTPFRANYPELVLAYDDGNSQTILLPTEAQT